MMRKLIFVGVLVLAMSSLALAQDFPKFEIFGGYSYLRSDLNSNDAYVFDNYSGAGQFGGAGNLSGFETSLTYNLNPWLGIKADFSSHFGRSNFSDSWDSTNGFDDYYGDFQDSYHYSYKMKGKATVHRYTYLFGPEFSYRGNSKVRPFAHALFGFTKVNVSKMNIDYATMRDYIWNGYSYEYIGNITGSGSSTQFAMALGGGLDINVDKKWAIRLAQIDYVPTWGDIKMKTVGYEEYYYDGSYEDNSYYLEKGRTPRERFNNLRISAGIVFKF